LGPANLPPEAVQQFYKAVSQAAEKPEVQAALRTGGLQIDVLNPADFKALLATDFERWGATVRQAGIKAQ
jgi:tripartite-type tricarboxylate transporter receptor subunit TctC